MTKKLMLILSLMALSGIAAVAAEIPQWVQPGVSATYRMVTTSVQMGHPPSENSSEALVTLSVDSVSGTGVTGTKQVYDTLNGTTSTEQVTCPEGGPTCPGRFWLDPVDPTGSLMDEQGETYHLMGTTSHSFNGRIWDAATMEYADPKRGLHYTVVYDTRSGLIFSYAREYLNRWIYMNLESTTAAV
jgi:hypothetical protein